jgi:predicted PurR-regulated permease PerM
MENLFKKCRVNMTLQVSPQPYNWTFRRVVWATLVLVSVVLGFWLLYRFNQVIFILFIAMVIGTVIRPFVNWLYQRGVPRIIGIILIYLLTFSLLVGFLLVLSPLIIQQSRTIVAAIPGYYQNLRAWMVNYSNPLIARFSAFLPVLLPGLTAAPQPEQDVMISPEKILGYVTTASRFLFITLVLLVLIFYWTLDGPRTIQSLLLLLPQEERENIRELISAMESRLSFYIVGQGILCVVIGIMALIAYTLIGLPNALVLALIAGVLEAVPMVGPLLGAIPAAMAALAIAPAKLVWVIIATLLIQQLENILLVPRVMSKAVGVNPFVTLLALFAFGSFFGITGALMAIPIAAIIQLLLNHFVFHPMAMEAEVPDGRDSASRLRYEAQEFTQDLRKQARVKKRGSDLKIKQIDHVMDEIETITTDLDVLLAQDDGSVSKP